MLPELLCGRGNLTKSWGGKWEVGSGKWEVGSGEWLVGGGVYK